VRVTVSGTTVKSLEFLSHPSNSADFIDRRFYPRDVDSLFEIVDDAYVSRAYKIEVTFDDTYGYPIKTLIDRNRDTVDDESAFELAHFEASHVGYRCCRQGGPAHPLPATEPPYLKGGSSDKPDDI
jgi:hypothetical protein